jgi:hypothetical protein
VVRAAGDEPREREAAEDRGDDRDIREVGAAAERVIHDPRLAGALLGAEDRGNGVGHRPQVHRDVLGLHDQLAPRLE